MLIIKFRGKYILLSNLQLSFCGFAVTTCLLLLLEMRKRFKRKKKLLKFNNILNGLRGGGINLRRLLCKKFKKVSYLRVKDKDLIQFIRKLTITTNDDGILYIDVEILAYALEHINDFRIDEILSKGPKMFRRFLINTSVFILGIGTAIVTNIIFGLKVLVITTAVGSALIFSPLRENNTNKLENLPLDHNNIEYVMIGPGKSDVIVSIAKAPAGLNAYRIDGMIQEEKTDGNSFTSTSEAKGKSDLYMRHEKSTKSGRVMTLDKLAKKIPHKDYSEAEDDAKYVRSGILHDRVKVRAEKLK